MVANANLFTMDCITASVTKSGVTVRDDGARYWIEAKREQGIA